MKLPHLIEKQEVRVENYRSQLASWEHYPAGLYSLIIVNSVNSTSVEENLRLGNAWQF